VGAPGRGRPRGTGDRLTSDEREELKRLRAENSELRRANEILKAASALFAKELDRPGRSSHRDRHKVPGVTIRCERSGFGRMRASAASTARSGQVIFGFGLARCRTATS
jgi:hypothetical protein